jgi:hypothetical protein
MIRIMRVVPARFILFATKEVTPDATVTHRQTARQNFTRSPHNAVQKG